MHDDEGIEPEADAMAYWLITIAIAVVALAVVVVVVR